MTSEVATNIESEEDIIDSGVQTQSFIGKEENKIIKQSNLTVNYVNDQLENVKNTNDDIWNLKRKEDIFKNTGDVSDAGDAKAEISEKNDKFKIFYPIHEGQHIALKDKVIDVSAENFNQEYKVGTSKSCVYVQNSFNILSQVDAKVIKEIPNLAEIATSHKLENSKHEKDGNCIKQFDQTEKVCDELLMANKEVINDVNATIQSLNIENNALKQSYLDCSHSRSSEKSFIPEEQCKVKVQSNEDTLNPHCDRLDIEMNKDNVLILNKPEPSVEEKSKETLFNCVKDDSILEKHEKNQISKGLPNNFENSLMSQAGEMECSSINEKCDSDLGFKYLKDLNVVDDTKDDEFFMAVNNTEASLNSPKTEEVAIEISDSTKESLHIFDVLPSPIMTEREKDVNSVFSSLNKLSLPAANITLEYQKVIIIADRDYVPLLEQIQISNSKVIFLANEDFKMEDCKEYFEKNIHITEATLYLFILGIHSISTNVIFRECKSINCGTPLMGLDCKLFLGLYSDRQVFGVMDKLSKKLIDDINSIKSLLPSDSDIAVLPPVPVSLMPINMKHKKLHRSKVLYPLYILPNFIKCICSCYPHFMEKFTLLSLDSLISCHVKLQPSVLNKLSRKDLAVTVMKCSDEDKSTYIKWIEAVTDIINVILNSADQNKVFELDSTLKDIRRPTSPLTASWPSSVSKAKVCQESLSVRSILADKIKAGTSADNLKTYFNQFGEIESVYFFKKENEIEFKSAFITFISASMAKNALKKICYHYNENSVVLRRLTLSEFNKLKGLVGSIKKPVIKKDMDQDFKLIKDVSEKIMTSTGYLCNLKKSALVAGDNSLQDLEHVQEIKQDNLIGHLDEATDAQSLQEIHEPVHKRTVLVNYLMKKTSAEAIISYFQTFGDVIGIHMKIRKKWKSALLIFSKSSIIEEIFKKERHKIDGRVLQIHRSLWPQDQTRLESAIILPITTVPTNVTRKKKAIDITSSMPTVQVKDSIKKTKKGNKSEREVQEEGRCRGVAYGIGIKQPSAYPDWGLACDVGEHFEKIKSLYKDKLHKIIKMQKNRSQNKICIVSDEMENFEVSLGLSADHDERVDVLKIPELKLRTVYSALKLYSNYKKGTIFIISGGYCDLISSVPCKECGSPQNFALFRNFLDDSHYFIKKLLQLHINVLLNTQNDIVLFCGLIPISFYQYNQNAPCFKLHVKQDIPILNSDSCSKVNEAVGCYNAFVKYHSESLNYNPWIFQKRYSDINSTFSVSDSVLQRFYCKEVKSERIKQIKALCKECLAKFSLIEPLSACIIEEKGKAKNDITELKAVSQISLREIDRSSARSTVIKNQPEPSFVPSVNRQSCDNELWKKVELLYKNQLLEIMKMQENRSQNKICIVTDERENFEVSLRLAAGLDDRRVDVLTIPEMKLSTVHSALKSYPSYGEGIIFIFSGGNHDLITSVPSENCLKLKCHYLQNFMIFDSCIKDTQHLIKVGLKLHKYILEDTFNDVVLFCGLVPTLLNHYNYYSTTKRPCRLVHSVQDILDLNPALCRNYTDAVDWFNTFTKYHAKILNYTPWDLEMRYFTNSNPSNILSPNSYNFCKEEEMERANHVISLCMELFPTLSPIMKPSKAPPFCSLPPPDTQALHTTFPTNAPPFCNVSPPETQMLHTTFPSNAPPFCSMPPPETQALHTTFPANAPPFCNVLPPETQMLCTTFPSNAPPFCSMPPPETQALHSTFPANVPPICSIPPPETQALHTTFPANVPPFCNVSPPETQMLRTTFPSNAPPFCSMPPPETQALHTTFIPISTERENDIKFGSACVESKLGNITDNKQMEVNSSSYQDKCLSEIKELYRTNLQLLLNTHKGRVQNNIVIVTDERDTLHLSLKGFDDKVTVLTIPDLKLTESFAAIKSHTNFGIGTLFVFSCGINDVIKRKINSDCLQLNCQYPSTVLIPSSFTSDSHYLIKAAFDISTNLILATKNDIALFCGIIPVSFLQYNGFITNNRLCYRHHPAWPQCIDQNAVEKYEEMILNYNCYAKYHAEFLDFTSWDMKTIFHCVKKTYSSLLDLNGYNVSFSENLKRNGIVKLLCTELLMLLKSSVKNVPNIVKLTPPPTLPPILSSKISSNLPPMPAMSKKDTTFQTPTKIANVPNIVKLTPPPTLPPIPSSKISFNLPPMAAMSKKDTTFQTPTKIAAPNPVSVYPDVSAKIGRRFDQVVIVADRRYASQLKNLKKSEVLLLADQELTIEDFGEYLMKERGYLAKRTLYLLVIGIHSITKTVRANICKKRCCINPLQSIDVINTEIVSYIENCVQKLLGILKRVKAFLTKDSNIAILPPLPISLMNEEGVHNKVHEKKLRFPNYFIANTPSSISSAYQIWMSVLTGTSRATLVSCIKTQPPMLSNIDSRIMNLEILDGCDADYPNYLIWNEICNKIIDVALEKLIDAKTSPSKNNIFRSDLEVASQPAINKDGFQDCGNYLDHRVAYDHLVFIGKPDSLQLIPNLSFIKNSQWNLEVILKSSNLEDEISTFIKNNSLKKILWIVISDASLISAKESLLECTLKKCKQPLPCCSKIGTIEMRKTMLLINSLLSSIKQGCKVECKVIVAPITPIICVHISTKTNVSTCHSKYHDYLIKKTSVWFLKGFSKEQWDIHFQTFEKEWTNMALKISLVEDYVHLQRIISSFPPESLNALKWVDLSAANTLMEVESRVSAWKSCILDLAAKFWVISTSTFIPTKIVSTIENTNSVPETASMQKSSTINTTDEKMKIKQSFYSKSIFEPNEEAASAVVASECKSSNKSLKEKYLEVKRSAEDSLNILHKCVSRSKKQSKSNCVNINKTHDDVITFSRNILNLTQNIKVANCKRFNNVFVVGKEELIKPFSSCNINSILINHNFDLLYEDNASQLLNKFTTISKQSLCCLVFDLSILFTSTVLSTVCISTCCPSPLSLTCLKLKSSDHSKVVEETKVLISNQLQNIEKYIKRLSQYISVIVVPLVPVRVYCVEGGPGRHDISHSIFEKGFSVISGSGDLWTRVFQLLLCSWNQLLVNIGKEYEFLNYVSSYNESNTILMLNDFHEFESYWSEPDIWIAFVETILSSVVTKKTENYLAPAPVKCNLDKTHVIISKFSSIPHKFFEDFVRCIDSTVEFAKEKDKITVRNISVKKATLLVYKLNGLRIGMTILKASIIDDPGVVQPEISLMQSLYISAVFAKIYATWTAQIIFNYKMNEFEDLTPTDASFILSSKAKSFKSPSNNNSQTAPAKHKSSEFNESSGPNVNMSEIQISTNRMNDSKLEAHNRCRSKSLSHEERSRSKSLSKSISSKERHRSKSSSKNRKSRSTSRKRRSSSNSSSKNTKFKSTSKNKRSRSRSLSKNRKSRPVSRKRRSRSKSLSRKRKTRSTSKKRRSNSKFLSKNRKSESISRKRSRSKSMSKSRKRRSRSSSLSRNIKSRSVSRKRMSRSKSLSKNRKSRSVSRKRRSRSKSLSKNRKSRSVSRRSSRSKSLTKNRKSRSASRKRSSRSKSSSKERLPRSRSTSQSRFHSIFSKGEVTNQQSSLAISPVLKKLISEDKKKKPTSEVDIPSGISNQKRPLPIPNLHSPVAKKTRYSEHPSALQQQENVSSIHLNLQTQDELRSQLGANLFAEYIETLQRLFNSFERECEIYKDVPELHPQYKEYYDCFIPMFLAQHSGDDENLKTRLWQTFWQSKFDHINKEFWKMKQKTITEEFLKKAFKQCDKGILISNSNVASSSFSMDEGLLCLEKLCDHLSYLGTALKHMITSCRNLGTNTKEGYKIFTEAENVALVKLVLDKLNILRPNATGSLLSLICQGANFIPNLLHEAQKGPSNVNVAHVPIDINAVAKASLGQSTPFIIELIEAALAYEGIQNPPQKVVNDLFRQVCTIHYKLTSHD